MWHKTIQMKEKNLNQEINKSIQLGPMEDFDKGYNPVEDIICQLENDSEYDSSIHDNEFWRKLYEEERIEEYERYKENERWEYRCRLRGEMAPGFYQTYFMPFINKTLKEVYDNDQTEELKFYKPPFEEWIFMILAVITEYYFREEYPFVYDRLNWFNLNLHRGHLKNEINRRYNAVTW